MQSWLGQCFVALIYASKHLANSSLCNWEAPLTEIVRQYTLWWKSYAVTSFKWHVVRKLLLSRVSVFYGDGARAQLRVIKLTLAKQLFPNWEEATPSSDFVEQPLSNGSLDAQAGKKNKNKWKKSTTLCRVPAFGAESPQYQPWIIYSLFLFGARAQILMLSIQITAALTRIARFTLQGQHASERHRRPWIICRHRCGWG